MYQKMKQCVVRFLFLLLICALHSGMEMGISSARGDQIIGHQSFTVLCFHDVPDTIDPTFERDSILVGKLTAQFQWLKQNGYNVVSIQDLIDAQQGKKPLPEKAVLLTFDDAYKSFYERVFPLLKAFHFPALLAVCGDWVDHSHKLDDKKRPYGEKYMTWNQVKEVYDSGLVEIGNHSYNLHHGEMGNPQGNKEPLAVTVKYQGGVGYGGYESISTLKHRIHHDIDKNSAVIAHHTGKRPRVMVWPYGRFSKLDVELAAKAGMPINMRLSDDVKNNIQNLSEISRNYYSDDEGLFQLIDAVNRWKKKEIKPIRSIRIDLDHIYDPDPVQVDKNLGKLVERIHKYQINTVFLQAYVDDKALGYAKELYFPNRHLPMKADLLNRVTWQLHTRGHVQVYAWMPLLGFDFGREDLLVKSARSGGGSVIVDPDKYKRVSPFNREGRQRILDIYEDLAIYVPLDGIAFHDDGVLTDFEDVSPEGIQAQVAAGFPSSIEEIKGNPQEFANWSRWKTEALTKFSMELKKIVQKYRGEVRTTRSLFAMPVINPISEEWFAQNLDNFIKNYDFVALMAMPQMEKAEEPDWWMKELVEKVKEHPQGLQKTLFELQSVDWDENNEPIDPHVLVDQMRDLQVSGALNFGYYPDDFVKNIPDASVVREGLSMQKELFID